ncbi:expressed conserved protein [Echinococcus multilocularis]|uniref:Expressed conserved protein n=1 Tax=Echinococcus multilocularis TaxID=6211 RepID=A0A068Y0K3_ECHMU|nr:expressed conserved protein [Echinococcus multilocularis]
MPIRKRKPFERGRFLGPVFSERLRKLEAIKQQLLELDNRLKMEVLVLRELSGNPVNVNEKLGGFVAKMSKSLMSEVLSSSIAQSTLTPRVQSSPDVPDHSTEEQNKIFPTRIFLLPKNPLALPSTSATLPLPLLQQQQQGQQSQGVIVTKKGKGDVIPVVVDISNQPLPPTLGLHGSLESNAFLSYAADLLALPTHISASKPPHPDRRFPSSKGNFTCELLVTPSTSVDLDVR